MLRNRFPTQNKLNDLFGGSFSHSVPHGILFVLFCFYLCLLIISSDFFYFYGTSICMKVCASIYMYFFCFYLALFVLLLLLSFCTVPVSLFLYDFIINFYMPFVFEGEIE